MLPPVPHPHSLCCTRTRHTTNKAASLTKMSIWRRLTMTCFQSTSSPMTLLCLLCACLFRGALGSCLGVLATDSESRCFVARYPKPVCLTSAAQQQYSESTAEALSPSLMPVPLYFFSYQPCHIHHNIPGGHARRLRCTRTPPPRRMRTPCSSRTWCGTRLASSVPS